jgi:hypothetical protein
VAAARRRGSKAMRGGPKWFRPRGIRREHRNSQAIVRKRGLSRREREVCLRRAAFLAAAAAVRIPKPQRRTRMEQSLFDQAIAVMVRLERLLQLLVLGSTDDAIAGALQNAVQKESAAGSVSKCRLRRGGCCFQAYHRGESPRTHRRESEPRARNTPRIPGKHLHFCPGA